MRLTIKTKLAAVFGVVVALSAGSMFIALQNLGELNTELETIGNVRSANRDADEPVKPRVAYPRPDPDHRSRGKGRIRHLDPQ